MTDRENALPATVYRDILNTGQSRVHMGNVVNNLNVQFTQQGPRLPATASISAYESFLILDGFYRSFCHQLESFVNDNANAPESAPRLLRESVGLGEIIAQVLMALDSGRGPSSNVYIRPEDISVSLTDALLLICQVRTSITPLLGGATSQTRQTDSRWHDNDSDIVRITRGLQTQKAAFTCQLAILSCTTDLEAAETCDALHRLVQERISSNQALRKRVSASHSDPEHEVAHGAAFRGTDRHPLVSDDAPSEQVSNVHQLDSQTEREIWRSQAYGVLHRQSVSATSTNKRSSLQTTASTDTFFSAYSAIMVPVFESELSGCLPDSFAEIDTPRKKWTTKRDWSYLSPIVEERGTNAAIDKPAVAPLWGQAFNSDSITTSPWSGKVVLNLDGAGLRPHACLLVVHKLMLMVEQLERDDSEGVCQSSVSYRWSGDGSTSGLLSEYGGIFRPCDYVDYFCGTGSGGQVYLGHMERWLLIFLTTCRVGAMMLGRQRMTTRQAIERSRINHALCDNNRSVLKGISGTRTHDVGLALQIGLLGLADFANIFGKDFQRLTETDKMIIRERADKLRLQDRREAAPRTMVVAAGGMQPYGSNIFRSYHASQPSSRTEENYVPPLRASSEPLWKVAQATDAISAYLDSAPVRNPEADVDGFVKFACDEVKRKHGGSTPYMMISISALAATQDRWYKSIIPIVRNTRGYERERVSRYYEMARSSLSKERYEVPPLRPTAPEASQCEVRAEAAQDSDGIDGHRFKISGEGLSELEQKLDDWLAKHGDIPSGVLDGVVKDHLKFSGLATYSLERCARDLVDVRRRRQKTLRWESYALELSYTCPIQRQCSALAFSSRLELRQHALDVHRKVISRRFDDAWYCSSDECDVKSEWVFRTESKYLDHMREIHGVHHHRIMTVHELEQWLDEGRKDGLGPLGDRRLWRATSE